MNENDHCVCVTDARKIWRSEKRLSSRGGRKRRRSVRKKRRRRRKR